MLAKQKNNSYSIQVKAFLLWGMMLSSFGSWADVQTVKQIDDYLYTYVKTKDFSGCVAIKQQGNLLYANCFGQADSQSGSNNTPQTQFMVGSISKQFTAAAILVLQQQGKLKTTDTLQKYYPEFGSYHDITIEHVLTHRAGIKDLFNISRLNTLQAQNFSTRQYVQQLLQEPLNFRPGSQYAYSNGGYLLLADLIEQVSGQSYAGFMRTHVFGPLNMHDTGHLSAPKNMPQLAKGHNPRGYADWVVAKQVDGNLMAGSGSIYSSLSDLYIWSDVLKNRSFLSQSSWSQLFKDYGNAYGYGLSVYQVNGKTVYGHDGRIEGYIADFLHWVESDTTLLVLGNIQTGVADFLRRDLGAILQGKKPKSAAKSIPASGEYVRPLSDYEGRYQFGPNLVVSIEAQRGVLQAQANQGGFSELIPLINGQLFSRVLYAHIEFKTDVKNNINEMLWINNEGSQFSGTKQVP